MTDLEGRMVRIKGGDPDEVFFVKTVADSPTKGECAQLRRVTPARPMDISEPVAVTELEVVGADVYPIGDGLSRLVTQNLLGKVDRMGISMRAGATEFKPFQFRPLLSYLANPHRRILIADETGLGKTISAIYILIEEMSRDPMERVIIICPSHLRYKWKRELKSKFGLHFDLVKGRRLLNAMAHKRMRYIVSMDAMRTMMDEFREVVSTSPPIDMLIVDEAHNHIGRSGETLRREFVQAMSTISKRTIGLTATPLQIELMDLKRVLEVVDPIEWVDNGFEDRMELQRRFNEMYILLSKKEWDAKDQQELMTRLDDTLKWVRSHGFVGTSKMLSELSETIEAVGAVQDTDRVRLRRRLWKGSPLAGHFTRARKVMVGEFREREPITITLELEDISEDVGKKGDVKVSERSVFSEIDSFLKDHFHYVHRRQLSSCLPAMKGLLECGMHGFPYWTKDGKTQAAEELEGLDDEDKEGWKRRMLTEAEKELCVEFAQKLIPLKKDTKFKRMMEEIEKLRARGDITKVIVFTGWRPTLKHFIKKAKGIKGIPVFIISGTDPVERRELIASRFQEHDGFAVLFTADVVAEGIDLQTANCIVNYDLPYNPQRVEQRIGRVDRIGQKAERIYIVNLLVEGSTDQVIYDTLLSRIGIFERYIGDMPTTLERNWSAEELIDSDEVAKEADRLETLIELQGSEGLQGLDDVLDDETREIHRRRRLDMSELRLLALRDFFQMILGKGTIEVVGGGFSCLKVKGLTRNDAETISRTLPMEVVDEVRRILSMFADSGGELTISSEKVDGAWQVPLMHPLMTTAVQLTHRHHYQDVKELPTEVIRTKGPINDLLEVGDRLIISEHNVRSSIGDRRHWKWWRAGPDGSGIEVLEGLDVKGLYGNCVGVLSMSVRKEEVERMLSSSVLERIEEEHTNWLRSESDTIRSQALSSKEMEKERVRVQIWRMEKMIEEKELAEDIVTKLKGRITGLDRTMTRLGNDIERLSKGNDTGVVVEDELRIVCIIEGGVHNDKGDEEGQV